MKKKKLLAVLCAGALALALAVPAFAALETEFTATTTIPDTAGTISVTVPATSGKLYINKDGAPYDLKDATVGAYKVKGGAVTDGFFSDPGLLVNTGETELDVKVSMTATPVGNVKLAASASDGEIALAGKLYVAECTVDGAIVTADWDGATDIAIAATVPATAAGTLPGADTEDDGFGGSTTVNGFLAYRLAGDLDIAEDYTDDIGGGDTLSVKVVFTLSPAAGTP